MTFDNELWVKVTENVPQYPLHHVTYLTANFEVSMPKGHGGDAFTRKIHYFTFALGVKVTQNVAQFPLHHVTYTPGKFEVAMSNGLGDHLQENTLFDLWP